MKEETDLLATHKDTLITAEEQAKYTEAKMGTFDVKLNRKTNFTTKSETETMTLKLTYNAPNSIEYKWEITKTFKSFKDFLGRIQFEMTKNGIETPGQRFTYLFNLMQSSSFTQLKAREEEIKEFIDLLGAYTPLKQSIPIHEYFEVSRHSFIPFNNGIKPKEGYIYKLSDYGKCQKSCISICNCMEVCCCTSWLKRWFLLKPDMLCFLEKSDSEIGSGTFWFDKAVSFQKDGLKIILRNQKMTLTLKFEEEFERNIWYDMINWRVNDFLKEHIGKTNDYESFASPKTQCRARWFIDGEDYFKDLHEKLLQAQQTVFITDWWMSPEVFLIRPVSVATYNTLEFQQALKTQEQKQLTRLCDILNYIAKKGVRIYVLVYCEFSLALTLNSKHTKQFLINLDKNINVARHPKNSFDLLWSHHEKLVVIDQKLAYVGGLDLCWGRYDNDHHILSEPENKEGVYQFPGIDFSNGRMGDFMSVENYLKESVDRIQPRMPWHDIHSRIEGPAVLDISRHFVERWNYAKSYLNEGGITDIKTKFTVRDDLQKQKTGMYDRSKTRMEGNNALKLNEIQLEEIRKNADFEEDNFDKVQGVQSLQQKIAGSLKKNQEGAFSKMKNSVKKKMMDKLNMTKKELLSNYVNLKAFEVHFQKNERKMRCQCLRSLSNWSCGLPINETEHSILNAYLDLIDNANHYIYIENQFFISKSFEDDENYDTAGASNLVMNTIALHLFNRIKLAYEEKKKFKVIIFIPLLPGFAGEIPTSSTLQVILKYTYKTISRNNGLSLIEKLASIMGNQYNHYIKFFSLRQHGIVNGIPRTELIYIHSKLMIVDDLYVIMGSANINDRSMIGERDSEFAVLYKEDPPTFDSMMDGVKGKSSFFAHTLRMRLWSEHMGVELKDTELINELFDPLNDHILEHMTTIAKKNTEVYREVFNCYPDDKMTNFKDLPVTKTSFTDEEIKTLKEEYDAKSKDITGHIVEFPLNFLESEMLQRSFFSAEMLVPIKNFT